MESAIHLAVMLGHRNMPLTEVLDGYEQYMDKQWLRRYMRSKMINQNKDLFETIDEPLHDLELMHFF